MTNTIFYIVLIVAILVALYFITNSFQKRQLKRDKGSDAYANQKPAEGNENLDMIDDDIIDNATPEEAREILRKMKAGSTPSLSDDDFFRLKRKIEEG